MAKASVKQVWKCPACKYRYKVDAIPLETPPAHQHESTKQVYVMELETDERTCATAIS